MHISADHLTILCNIASYIAILSYQVSDHYHYLYIYTGQVYIPGCTKVQCFDSPNCAADTKSSEFKDEFTIANNCCLVSSAAGLSPVKDFAMKSFRFDNGECQPCNRECCS